MSASHAFLSQHPVLGHWELYSPTGKCLKFLLARDSLSRLLSFLSHSLAPRVDLVRTLDTEQHVSGRDSLPPSSVRHSL